MFHASVNSGSRLTASWYRSIAACGPGSVVILGGRHKGGDLSPLRAALQGARARAVLVGEAALFGSPWLLIWSAAFLAVNCVYFSIYEEPGLERRFGEEYRLYKRNVPRWIPRRTPWAPSPTEHGLFG